MQTDYQCKVGDTIIWDVAELINGIPKSGNLILSEDDLEPQKINGSIILLAKTRINVRSTINDCPNSDELISAWKYANSEFPLTRLLMVFVREYARNLNPVIKGQTHICQLDPPIVELTRMSFYYHRCSRLNTDAELIHKRAEIKKKLLRKLLKNLERYGSRKILGEDEYEGDLDELVQGEIQKLEIEKPLDSKFDERFFHWMKSISSINAELIFARLLEKHNISFASVNNENESDFWLDGNNVQVKAAITYRKDQTKQSEYIDRIREYIKMIKNKTVTDAFIIAEIKNFLESEFSSRIIEALNQKSDIICVDGTQAACGYLLNQWTYINDIHIPIENSISKCLRHKESAKNYIPLIFGSGAYAKIYRFQTLCFRIAKFDGKIEVKLDEVNQITSSKLFSSVVV